MVDLEPVYRKAEALIDKYYPDGTPVRGIFLDHAHAVTALSLKIAEGRPALSANPKTLVLSGMLHDIGIMFTDAPGLGCFGNLPYLAHGYKGRELLESEGLHLIAPVCERHIGVGITEEEIRERNLPVPVRDMSPQTIEEKIVCYADKFFSKSSKTPMQPKPLEEVMKGLEKFGYDKVIRFDAMKQMFGTETIYDPGMR